jgi:shikimate kinase
VYLHAPPTVLADRLRAAGDDYRPFLEAGIDGVLRDQYEARDSAYRAIAQLVVDATHMPAAIVDEIMQWLGEARM